MRDNQIRVGVVKFALTSNNITYARLGEATAYTTISYWRFFPAEPGWGCVPAWGIGAVVASRHAGVAVGERLYGYFPMASHLVMTPSDLRGRHFVDVTEHRASLPPIYNEYRFIDRDPEFDRAHEDEYLILWPGFCLSFCLDVFIREQNIFGARRIVISSASSKAALGLALLLAGNRPSGIEIVGLTSQSKAAFVADRRVYDRVSIYEDLNTLPSDAATTFVDITGNSELATAVHRRLKHALVYSCLAGFTHWDAVPSELPETPGPARVLFSTPANLVKRRTEWGVETFRKRFNEAWRYFLAFTGPWLNVERTTGRAGVERVYREVLEGRTPPYKAHVLSVTDERANRVAGAAS